jgi:hypothetical protein
MKPAILLRALATLAFVACATPGGVREAIVSPVARAPLSFAAIEAPPAPAPARDAAAWTLVRAGADVTPLAVAPFPDPTRGAWVLDADGLWRVAIDGPRAAWTRVPLPSIVGAPSSIAALDHDRLAVATSRGVVIVSGDDVRLLQSADDARAKPPDALAGAGGEAWVVWDGAVLRTDGVEWAELARGLAAGPGTRLTIEDDGDAATVVDAHGAAFRVTAVESIHLEGLADGAHVTDTRWNLAAVPAPGTSLAKVDYAVDGKVVATATRAPWGWGADGAPSFDLSRATFGAHEIRVSAATTHGAVLTRTLHVDYASPFAAPPSYARDVAPIVRASCARCHTRGPGRDLSTYDRTRPMAPSIRNAVRSSRMPPDFALDPESISVLTAWVDSGALP